MNKLNINLEKDNIIIHCNTEEKATDLLRFLDSKGYKWSFGTSLLDKDNKWHCHEEDMCYRIDNKTKQVNYSDIDFYETNYSTITIENWELINLLNRNNLDLNDGEKVLITCSTEEKAIDLLDFLHENGFKWYNGEQLKNNPFWYKYKERICYNVYLKEKYVLYTNKTYEELYNEWEIVEKEYSTSEIISMLEKDNELEFKAINIPVEYTYDVDTVKLCKRKVLCWGGDSLYPFVFSFKEQLKWTLVKEKEYKIYKVEFSPNGRLFLFICDEELEVNSLVSCKSLNSHVYGIVKEISKRKLTKEELSRYKTCSKVEGLSIKRI